MILLFVLITVLFVALAALALFFLFTIFLPTLGQQGTPVDEPLTTLSPAAIPVPAGIRPEFTSDFLLPRHNSPKDCMVAEVLSNYPKNRKRIQNAFLSCRYICPRLQIDFRTLMDGAAPQNMELIPVPPCEYFAEYEAAFPRIQTIIRRAKPLSAALVRKVRHLVDTTQKGREPD
jgi:hypothetical protein